MFVLLKKEMSLNEATWTLPDIQLEDTFGGTLIYSTNFNGKWSTFLYIWYICHETDQNY